VNFTCREKNASSKEKNIDKSLARKYDSTFTAIFLFAGSPLFSTGAQEASVLKAKVCCIQFYSLPSVKKRGNCFVWYESNGNRGRNEVLHVFRNLHNL
jgi:hypothetical protein